LSKLVSVYYCLVSYETEIKVLSSSSSSYALGRSGWNCILESLSFYYDVLFWRLNLTQCSLMLGYLLFCWLLLVSLIYVIWKTFCLLQMVWGAVSALFNRFIARSCKGLSCYFKMELGLSTSYSGSFPLRSVLFS